jgi:hypothetical protein
MHHTAKELLQEHQTCSQKSAALNCYALPVRRRRRRSATHLELERQAPVVAGVEDRIVGRQTTGVMAPAKRSDLIAVLKVTR